MVRCSKSLLSFDPERASPRLVLWTHAGSSPIPHLGAVVDPPTSRSSVEENPWNLLGKENKHPSQKKNLQRAGCAAKARVGLVPHLRTHGEEPSNQLRTQARVAGEQRRGGESSKDRCWVPQEDTAALPAAEG